MKPVDLIKWFISLHGTKGVKCVNIDLDADEDNAILSMRVVFEKPRKKQKVFRKSA